MVDVTAPKNDSQSLSLWIRTNDTSDLIAHYGMPGMRVVEHRLKKGKEDPSGFYPYGITVIGYIDEVLVMCKPSEQRYRGASMFLRWGAELNKQSFRAGPRTFDYYPIYGYARNTNHCRREGLSRLLVARGLEVVSADKKGATKEERKIRKHFAPYLEVEEGLYARIATNVKHFHDNYDTETTDLLQQHLDENAYPLLRQAEEIERTAVQSDDEDEQNRVILADHYDDWVQDLAKKLDKKVEQELSALRPTEQRGSWFDLQAFGAGLMHVATTVSEFMVGRDPDKAVPMMGGVSY